MLQCPKTRLSRTAAAAALAALAGLAAQAQAQVDLIEPHAPQPRRADPPPLPPPPPEAPRGPIADGPNYEVAAFILRYATDHPDRPLLEEFNHLPVELGVADGVYVASRPGAEPVTLTIEQLLAPSTAGRRFSVSAINAIGASIVRELNRRGVIGVLVVPDPAQINPETLQDVRPPASRTLTLDIWTRAVSQIRTLGAGERWGKPEARLDRPSAETRINNRVHDRIRDNSPLQPGLDGTPGDLLRKSTLDDYLYRLNRHPGRRVDAAIASGETPGDVVLDYIVTENKPWTVYFQLSNTGTDETNEWRQRFGFVHNQLLNRDDILSLDYITAGFDETNAFVGSYNAPIGGSDYLRFKVYGSYSDFTASDVGFANERFTGTSWIGGGEIIANVFQRRLLFVDLFAGARYEHHEVDSLASEGQTDFFLPYIGARLERVNEKAALTGEVRVEASLPDVTGTDSDEAQRLGRLFVDDDWVALKWDLGFSFFLEPLLHGDEWANPEAPYRKTTLAHEMYFSLRGQYAFDNRIIPQDMFIAGGLYTVRGYPESVVAGDSAVMGTIEYRYHLPRAMAVREPATFLNQPFRWAPEQRYGRPDWDLIFRGFLDAARVVNSDRQSFESDETLISTGLGAEVVFKKNLSFRLDLGIPLKEVRETDAGEARLHFVGTILY